MITQFNDEDPEIVSFWLRRRLLDSPDVVALVKDRFYDQVGVPATPTYPYIYWTGDLIQLTQNSHVVTRTQWQYNVRAVWKSALTGSSFYNTRVLTRAIRRAISGDDVGGNVIDPLTNEQVGWVWQSKYIGWFRPPPNDDVTKNVRILERGVMLNLVTS